MGSTVQYQVHDGGIVTFLPFCMLLNPTRPGLVHSGYARVFFRPQRGSGWVDCNTAMGALYARRMSPRSGMLSNAGDQEGCGTLTLVPIMQVHNCITGVDFCILSGPCV